MAVAYLYCFHKNDNGNNFNGQIKSFINYGYTFDEDVAG